MEQAREVLAQWLNDPFIERLLFITIGIGVIVILLILGKRGLNKRIKNTDHKYRARKAANITAYIIMVALILFVFSDKLGNVGVALGMAGAGVAFALQEVIVSVAGWLYMMVAGSVSVGQRVKVGEVKGDIIDIGVLSSTIMEVGDWVDGDLYNGRIVSLSNSFVFKEKVHNYSSEFPFLWDEIQIPIRTESDYEKARKVFMQVLHDVCADYATKSEEKWNMLTNKYRVEDARVQPSVTLKFDENWITFTLRYVVDYKERRSTKDAIYSKLLMEISKYEDIINIAASTLEVTTINKAADHLHNDIV